MKFKFRVDQRNALLAGQDAPNSQVIVDMGYPGTLPLEIREYIAAHLEPDNFTMDAQSIGLLPSEATRDGVCNAIALRLRAGRDI